MVSTPADTPVTVPADTDAWLLLRVHIPPAGASVNVIDEPTHTTEGPAMLPGAGNGFTVTEWVAYTVPQLLETMYEIVTTPPETLVTIPLLPTVAIPVELLVHVP